jgi:hypothetical protein
MIFALERKPLQKPFNMKKIFLLVFYLLAGVFVTSSMQAQSLKNLEDNNGFKKYKLGSKFVLGLGVKHKDEEGADKIVVDYAKETIGDIPVKAIELYYLKDTLAKIVVQVSPEYYEKLIDACKSSFGQPTKDVSNNEKVRSDSTASPNYYKDNYMWKATRLRMEYFYLYPKMGSGAYGTRTLYLTYILNDYGQRLQRVQRGINSAKNF